MLESIITSINDVDLREIYILSTCVIFLLIISKIKHPK